ncbi:CPBP family glutamic-type intramembrane protease [Lysinibacillus sp. NPDC093190]|uniref:CPBP family glutamic-type intramembrane protease n=1 Tax=Lysinibacillus sp. NPDC093190 TaxID=3390575 RepID=UPI003D056E86
MFRGIIQNLLLVFLEHQWTAIIITTLLFLGMHTQYFKKPIMLNKYNCFKFNFRMALF